MGSMAWRVLVCSYHWIVLYVQSSKILCHQFDSFVAELSNFSIVLNWIVYLLSDYYKHYIDYDVVNLQFIMYFYTSNSN